MSAITMDLTVQKGEVVAQDLTTRLNACKTAINSIDANQLHTTAGLFSLGNTRKIGDALDPGGSWRDATDLQLYCTKNYLQNLIAEIDAKLSISGKVTALSDVAEANYTDPDSAAVTAMQYTPTAGAVSYTLTQDTINNIATDNQKAAMNAASTPTGANPFATMADVGGATGNLAAISPIADSTYGPVFVASGVTVWMPAIAVTFTAPAKMVEIKLGENAWFQADSTSGVPMAGVGYVQFDLNGMIIDVTNSKLYGGRQSVWTNTAPTHVVTLLNSFAAPKTLITGVAVEVMKYDIMGGFIPTVWATLYLYCTQISTQAWQFQAKLVTAATSNHMQEAVANAGAMGW